MSVFDDLARQPDAEIVVAVDLRSADPVTGEPTLYRVTDASSLHTLPGDDPPNATYDNVMTTGVRTTRALTEGPTFTGSMPPNTASFEVFNGNGALGNWRRQTWEGQPVTIRAGGELTATGEPYPFSEFVPYFTGTIRQKPTASAGNVVRFEAVGATTPVTDQPAVEEAYRAFGGAADLQSSLVRTDPPTTFGLPFTTEWIGRIPALPTVEMILLWRGGHTVFLQPSGQLEIAFPRVAIPYVVTPGQDLFISLSVASDLSATVMAGRNGRDLAVVYDSTIGPQPAPSPTRIFFGTTPNPPETWDAVIYEVRDWSTVRTLSEQAATADEPLLDLTDPALTEVWKFNTGTGTTGFGSKGYVNMQLLFAAAWTSSLEGDDPAVGGGLLGKTKPKAYGRPFGTPLSWVDSQTNQAQWSHGVPSLDVVALYLDGARMLPAVDFETQNNGDISWDNTGPTGAALVLLPGLGFDFRHLVPGQEDPIVIGQLIEFSPEADPPGYGGRFRVAELSADALRIELLDENSDPLPLLASTPFLAMSVLTSSGTERIFSWDLERSVITLNRSPGGELTVTAISEGGETLLASEAFSLVTGAAPALSLEVDPVVGFMIAEGEDVTVGQILDRIAASCFGWRGETRDGQHVLGSYRVPGSSPPVAALIGSRPAELEDRGITLPSVVAEIQTVEERTPTPPRWQVRVGHDRTWKILERAVGVLNEADRHRVTTTWREVKRTLQDVRRLPGAEAMAEPLPTYVVGRDQAVNVTDQLVVPLLTVERRWLDVEAVGLPTLALELGDEILIEHPDEDFDLVDPVPAVAWSLDEDTASNTTKIGAYL